MPNSLILFGLLFAATAQSGTMPGSVTLNDCLVALDEEAEVPAQEAGILLLLPVKEGQQVKNTELLAKIDDMLALRDKDVADNKLKVAREQANNKINVQYSEAAAEVANAVCARNDEANRKVKGTVPDALVQQNKLEYKAAVLSIDKSKMELRIAALQANVSEAELAQANEKIERRKIKSPLDGQVRKIYKHEGEWVTPGDAVLHVARVNRLRVEGFLNAANFAPEEISGRPVTINVVFARGRTESFSGKIVFVDPLVQAGGEYLVRALVQNREENGQWLLRAGMNAVMTIQLK